jgi:hypothetical protein
VSKRLVTMLAGVMALAALVGGCGSSDGSSDGGGDEGSLTKAEFVSQADAICKKRNIDTATKYGVFYKEHEKDKASKAEEEEMTDQVYIVNLESRLEALRGLAPPQGDAKDVTEMLDALEEGIEKMDAEDLEAYETGLKTFAKANRLSNAYGLKYCLTL